MKKKTDFETDEMNNRITSLLIAKEFNAEAIAEIAMGLCAMAIFRHEKENGVNAAADLADRMSSFTTKLHIEARRKEAKAA